METARKFLEEEFDVKERIKEVQIAREKGREMVIIQMDSWEKKQEIMRRNKKLRSKKIYINNDLTQEERGMQRKLREIAKEERTGGRRARVEYRRIEGQLDV